MLGGNRSELGIIILYSASEQGYLVLAVYKHVLLLLLYCLISHVSVVKDISKLMFRLNMQSD